ncbi:unnamed protein product [Mycena citricolor]|uniref:Transcription initiation factor IIB n=1 Tax=Mycena citricolor TaxID=2018698 RepID=A0AAD2GT67_9AGAR|nr:unnamed protein product [Mycena citricolor]CAK5263116.1 unnamed protein product [Mycena citricolor]CAK5275298.1 unnamed protein product [Mycena citricolor]
MAYSQPFPLAKQPGQQELPPTFRPDLNVRLICPDCKDPNPQIAEEFSSGDLVCASCGLVLGDRIVDTRSEWRTFANDEGDDPSRVGAASDPLLGEDLDTMVSFRDGGSGLAKELQRAASRAQSARSERSVLTAFRQIATWCDQFSLPKTISDIAKQLYKRSDDEKLLRGKPVDAVVAACIFLACRQARVSRAFREICEMTKVSKKLLGQCCKAIQKTLDLNNGSTTSTTQAGAETLLARYCNHLDLPPNVQSVCSDIIVTARKYGIAEGRSPLSIASGALYFTCALMGKNKSIREIAEVTKAGENTIKVVYRLYWSDRKKLVKKAWIDEGRVNLNNLPDTASHGAVVRALLRPRRHPRTSTFSLYVLSATDAICASYRSMPAITLPVELYASIAEQIPQDDRQSLLALTRALPHHPISIKPLFERIVFTRAEQAVLFTLRLLKPDGARVAGHVEEFRLEDQWTVDAEIVLNILSKLPRLRSLVLCIGTNFSPEHLRSVLERPRPELTNLSLIFRPYVQKATYQQFLSGSYFDPVLECLAQWPASNLPTLSIIQQPMDPSQAPKVSFAQPIVFFRLDLHLANLARSAYLSTLKSFRLRIPARPVAGPLTTHYRSLPSVELLDLSTCNVFGSDLTETIFPRLPRLAHLILDKTTLLRGDFHSEDWAVLGKGFALSGVRRMREREKKLRQARLETVAVEPAAVRRTARPGRKGVSTATISLRQSPPRETRVVGFRNTPEAVATRKVRLLPPPPAVRSFATTLPASVSASKHAEIREHFEQGWIEGLSQIVQIRARLFQSYRLGSTIMRFDDEDLENDSEEGLSGLVEVTDWEDELDIKAPVLCFAGPVKSDAHPEGCAHSFAWAAWDD